MNFGYVFTSLILLVQYAKTAKHCTTPLQSDGECIEIHECPPIINFLNSKIEAKENLTDHTLRVLRKSRCNSGCNVNVCCPIQKNHRTMLQEMMADENFNPLVLKSPFCGQVSINSNRFGQIANLNEFPWMALLEYEDNLKYLCSGTLINDRYILTAAHCISEKFKKIVHLGEYDLSSERVCFYGDCEEPTQDIPVEEIIVHPGYQSTHIISPHDIALLRLAKVVNYNNENVKPICLPFEANMRKKTLHSVLITGWGITEHKRTSNILLKAALPVQNLDKCTSVYKSRDLMNEYQIYCIGGDGVTDTCKGDNGGPLQSLQQSNSTFVYYQYGIKSFGSRFCGLKNTPMVTTKIEPYLNWIIENMRL